MAELLHDEFAEEADARRRLIPLAQRMLRTLQEAELLNNNDRLCLTAFAIGREAQMRLWPKGRSVSSHDLFRCMRVGARVLIDVFHPAEPQFQWIVPVLNRVGDWMRDLHGALQRADAGTGSLHDQALSFWFRGFALSFGPRRRIDQFRGIARKLAVRAGMVEPHSPLPPSLADGVLTFYRKQTFGEPGGIFVDADGDVVLGEHQVRDVLNKHWDVRAPRKKRTKDADDEARIGAGGDGAEPHSCDNDEAQVGPADEEVERARHSSEREELPVGTVLGRDEHALQALEAVEAKDMAEFARTWVERRRAGCRAGSIAERVLPYVVAFVAGDISTAEVARIIGHAQGAVHQALTEHKRDLTTPLRRGADS